MATGNERFVRVINLGIPDIDDMECCVMIIKGLGLYSMSGSSSEERVAEVTASMVVSNINACSIALKGLANHVRPETRNSESVWERFEEDMRMSVRHFDEFRRNVWETNKLELALASLEEADERLKSWAVNSEELYNDLAPQLLYCKEVIAWLLEHLREVSWEMVWIQTEVTKFQTEVTKGVVHQEGRMRELLDELHVLCV